MFLSFFISPAACLKCIALLIQYTKTIHLPQGFFRKNAKKTLFQAPRAENQSATVRERKEIGAVTRTGFGPPPPVCANRMPLRFSNARADAACCRRQRSGETIPGKWPAQSVPTRPAQARRASYRPAASTRSGSENQSRRRKPSGSAAISSSISATHAMRIFCANGIRFCAATRNSRSICSCRIRTANL